MSSRETLQKKGVAAGDGEGMGLMGKRQKAGNIGVDDRDRDFSMLLGRQGDS